MLSADTRRSCRGSSSAQSCFGVPKCNECCFDVSTTWQSACLDAEVHGAGMLYQVRLDLPR